MKHPKKRSYLALAGYIALIVVLGYIGYSVYYYLHNAESVEEYEVCYADKCIKTFHIHSKVRIEICGKEIHMPLEVGSLYGPHMHKEANLMHFHERLPYDQKTGKLLESKPLEVGEAMKAVDMRFSDHCLGDYCNGDSCPDGSKGKVKMTVNDVPNTQFDKYIWKDQDQVMMTFER